MEASSNAALFYNSSRGTGIEEGIEQMKLTESVEKKLVFVSLFCDWACYVITSYLVCILIGANFLLSWNAAFF